MNPKDFKDVLNRYAAEECSMEERRMIERLVLKNPIAKGWKWKSEMHKELTRRRMQEHIFNQIDCDAQRVRKNVHYWRGIAASLIFLIGIGTFFYFQDAENRLEKLIIAQAVEEYHHEVTLTHVDGKVEVLTDKDEVLDLRQVTEDIEDVGQSVMSLNTLRIPSQQQYSVILMDGTKVRLNAGSILTFPTRFESTNRTVFLDGEAYFEVVSNRIKPFKVIAKRAEIKVLGTKFNVSAYNSEPRIVTSLFEGRVEFSMDDRQYPLQPGYEIVADSNTRAVEMKLVDAEQVLAWKDGYFVFNNMDMVSVMKHVARWYNITVTAPVSPPNKRIGGTFPNTASLDDLLKDLEILSGAKFIRKGKEVQVIY